MPDESETLTVYDAAPARLGVPLMRQSRSRASPCGRAPPVKTQEYGGTPPVTLQVLEYGTPTSTPDTGQRPENGDRVGGNGDRSCHWRSEARGHRHCGITGYRAGLRSGTPPAAPAKKRRRAARRR